MKRTKIFVYKFLRGTIGVAKVVVQLKISRFITCNREANLVTTAPRT